MKKYISLFSSFIVVGMLFSGCSTNEQKVYPYSFNSLKVSYELSGDITGKSDYYIKGDKHRREMDTVMKIGDFEKENHSAFIEDKDTFYVLDLNEKTGVIMKNPTYQKIQSLPQDKKVEYLTLGSLGVAPDTVDETEKEQKLKVKEEKEILGKTCQVYEFSDGEVCLWNTIPLWTSLDQQGIKYTTEAKSIEENIDISDETFTVPQEVKMEDLRDYSNEEKTKQ